MVFLKQKNIYKKGFTITELVITIGIIALLMSLIVFILSPGDVLKETRDKQRTVHIQAIYDALIQKAYEVGGGGVWPQGIVLPKTKDGDDNAEFAVIGSEEGQVNLCEHLYPLYMSPFPVDPLVGEMEEDDCRASDYNTGYEIWQNPENDVVVIRAPHAEAITVVINPEELD